MTIRDYLYQDLWEEGSGLEIQYLGQSGYTQLCLLAIDAILNSGSVPERATVVTHATHKQPIQQEHLFLFWKWGHVPLIVVPSGFSSGYSGEGPRGFSLAICMIRSKKIPIDGIYVNRSEFATIDNVKLDNINHPILQKIKAKSEALPFPDSLWVDSEDEELLERGQLWRKFLWREPRTDWISEAVGDIDAWDPEVGVKLRLAIDKLKEPAITEEWQSAGILIRDAWIEFVQDLCLGDNIDLSGISPNDVKGILSKLKLNDEVLKLAKSNFDLSLKTQHDRNIDKSIAKLCVVSAALSMQALLYEMQEKTKPKRTQ